MGGEGSCLGWCAGLACLSCWCAETIISNAFFFSISDRMEGDLDHLNAEDIQEEIILEDGSQNPEDDYMEAESKDDDNDIGLDEEETLEDANLEEFADDSIQGFFEHHEPVYAVAIHPIDQSMVCSGGGDDVAYLWNMSTGETLCKLKGHSDSVVSVSFSVDGNYIASGGMDGKVIVSSTADGQLTCELEGPDEVTVYIVSIVAQLTTQFLCWHPRGPVLVAGSADGSLWMWSLPDGRFMHVFNGHAASVSHGSFTPDGSHSQSLFTLSRKTLGERIRGCKPHRVGSEIRITNLEVLHGSGPLSSITHKHIRYQSG